MCCFPLSTHKFPRPASSPAARCTPLASHVSLLSRPVPVQLASQLVTVLSTKRGPACTRRPSRPGLGPTTASPSSNPRAPGTWTRAVHILGYFSSFAGLRAGPRNAEHMAVCIPVSRSLCRWDAFSKNAQPRKWEQTDMPVIFPFGFGFCRNCPGLHLTGGAELPSRFLFYGSCCRIFKDLLR